MEYIDGLLALVYSLAGCIVLRIRQARVGVGAGQEVSESESE